MITLVLLVPGRGSCDRKVESSWGTCLEEAVVLCITVLPVHAGTSGGPHLFPSPAVCSLSVKGCQQTVSCPGES